MFKFNPVWVILISILMFSLTVVALALFGYEISRDSPFEVACEDVGGVYFLSKSNEEYCANSDFVFNPQRVDGR